MRRRLPGSRGSGQSPGSDAGASAQMDLVLGFFGIILVFLSLLTYSIEADLPQRIQSDFRESEPRSFPVHSPRLSYSVPYYHFLVLDAEGLARLDLEPVAQRLVDSDLTSGRFGLTLATETGRPYGTLSLYGEDLGGFRLDLDAAALGETPLRQPLISLSEGEPDAFLAAARSIVASESPGVALLKYASAQGALADGLVGIYLNAGWMISAEVINDGRIVIRKHPDDLALTNYFR